MINPDTILRMNEEVAQLLQSSSSVGLLVIDLHGHIGAANSFALDHLGAEIEHDTPLASLLEDPSGLAEFSPNSNDIKVLRFRCPSGKILVARCSVVFGKREGFVLIVPLSTGRDDGMAVMTRMNDELSTLTRNLSQRNAELEEARVQIRTLSGLLPICAVCKKINKGDDVWEPIETYIRKRTDADFTHGYCPDCYNKILAEIDHDIEK